MSPDLFTDEKVTELSIAARYLYLGLISCADDEGRFEWRAIQFRNRIFVCSITTAESEKLMQEIVNQQLVSVYEHAGRLFAYHPAWHKHQSTNRPTISVLPTPPGIQSRWHRGALGTIELNPLFKINDFGAITPAALHEDDRFSNLNEDSLRTQSLPTNLNEDSLRTQSLPTNLNEDSLRSDTQGEELIEDSRSTPTPSYSYSYSYSGSENEECGSVANATPPHAATSAPPESIVVPRGRSKPQRPEPSLADQAAWRILEAAVPLVFEYAQPKLKRVDWRRSNKRGAESLVASGVSAEDVVRMLRVAYAHPEASKYYGRLTRLEKLAEAWSKLEDFERGEDRNGSRPEFEHDGKSHMLEVLEAPGWEQRDEQILAARERRETQNRSLALVVGGA